MPLVLPPPYVTPALIPQMLGVQLGCQPLGCHPFVLAYIQQLYFSMESSFSCILQYSNSLYSLPPRGPQYIPPVPALCSHTLN